MARLCEARKLTGDVCGARAKKVYLAVPFRPNEPRSEGAVGRVVDPDLCSTHKRVLERVIEREGDVSALIERWGVIR